MTAIRVFLADDHAAIIDLDSAGVGDPLVDQGNLIAHVELRGVCPNARALAYDRARAAQATRILRLDPLGLRHLLPRGAIELSCEIKP